MLLEVERQKSNRNLEKAQKALTDARWRKKKQAQKHDADAGISFPVSEISEACIKHTDASTIEANQSIYETQKHLLAGKETVDLMEQAPTVKTVPIYLQEKFFLQPEQFDKYSHAYYAEIMDHSLASFEQLEGSLTRASIVTERKMQPLTTAITLQREALHAVAQQKSCSPSSASVASSSTSKTGTTATGALPAGVMANPSSLTAVLSNTATLRKTMNMTNTNTMSVQSLRTPSTTIHPLLTSHSSAALIQQQQSLTMASTGYMSTYSFRPTSNNTPADPPIISTTTGRGGGAGGGKLNAKASKIVDSLHTLMDYSQGITPLDVTETCSRSWKARVKREEHLLFELTHPSTTSSTCSSSSSAPNSRRATPAATAAGAGGTSSRRSIRLHPITAPATANNNNNSNRVSVAAADEGEEEGEEAFESHLAAAAAEQQRVMDAMALEEQFLSALAEDGILLPPPRASSPGGNSSTSTFRYKLSNTKTFNNKTMHSSWSMSVLRRSLGNHHNQNITYIICVNVTLLHYFVTIR